MCSLGALGNVDVGQVIDILGLGRIGSHLHCAARLGVVPPVGSRQVGLRRNAHRPDLDVLGIDVAGLQLVTPLHTAKVLALIGALESERYRLEHVAVAGGRPVRERSFLRLLGAAVGVSITELVGGVVADLGGVAAGVVVTLGLVGPLARAEAVRAVNRIVPRRDPIEHVIGTGAGLHASTLLRRIDPCVGAIRVGDLDRLRQTDLLRIDLGRVGMELKHNVDAASAELGELGRLESAVVRGHVLALERLALYPGGGTTGLLHHMR